LLVDDAVFCRDGLNGHHHDLRLRVLDEMAQPGELAAVVLETGRCETVPVSQRFLECVEGRENAFFDRNGGHEDDKLRQAVTLK
jgi:hypothetical protein